DGRPGRFLPGAIHLAARSGATVVPVGLVGCHAAWPAGGRPRRGPVAVRFGHPWTAPSGPPDRGAAAALADAVAGLIVAPTASSSVDATDDETALTMEQRSGSIGRAVASLELADGLGPWHGAVLDRSGCCAVGTGYGRGPCDGTS